MSFKLFQWFQFLSANRSKPSQRPRSRRLRVESVAAGLAWNESWNGKSARSGDRQTRDLHELHRDT